MQDSAFQISSTIPDDVIHYMKPEISLLANQHLVNLIMRSSLKANIVIWNAHTSKVITPTLNFQPIFRYWTRDTYISEKQAEPMYSPKLKSNPPWRYVPFNNTHFKHEYFNVSQFHNKFQHVSAENLLNIFTFYIKSFDNDTFNF